MVGCTTSVNNRDYILPIATRPVPEVTEVSGAERDTRRGEQQPVPPVPMVVDFPVSLLAHQGSSVHRGLTLHTFTSEVPVPTSPGTELNSRGGRHPG